MTSIGPYSMVIKVLAIQDVILAGTQKPIGDAAAEIITRLLRKAPARNIL